MKLYTKSRDRLYEANAEFIDGIVVVKKGSMINTRNSIGYKPKSSIKELREKEELFDSNGILLNDVSFNSLSSAATFVTGRNANGMIVWKTEDGKYARYTINPEENNG